MGQHLPDDIDLPPFFGGRNKKPRGEGSGNKPEGSIGAMAILLVAVPGAIGIFLFSYVLHGYLTT